MAALHDYFNLGTSWAELAQGWADKDTRLREILPYFQGGQHCQQPVGECADFAHCLRFKQGCVVAVSAGEQWECGHCRGQLLAACTGALSLGCNAKCQVSLRGMLWHVCHHKVQRGSALGRMSPSLQVTAPGGCHLDGLQLMHD